MKPSEIRAELLDQHRQIRELMGATRDVALRARAGDGGSQDLLASVLRLADRVRAHNLLEEELLRDLTLRVDARGPARAATVAAEHIKEHGRFQTALLGIPRTSLETAAVGVVALVALMREHMDKEEAAFLGEHVLADDVVVPEPSDG
jgi:hypothetical protein